MGATAIGINAGISIVETIAGVLLGQHTARLKDAKSENDAVSKIIPAWQADMQQIASAISSGQLSAEQGMQAILYADQQTFNYLKSQVGKTGTAWNGTPTGCPNPPSGATQALNGGQLTSRSGSHNCNSGCTVGCCIYYSYLEPAADCFYWRLSTATKGQTIGFSVPAINGNKYGFPSVGAFSVSCTIAQNLIEEASTTLTNTVQGLLDSLTTQSSGIVNSKQEESLTTQAKQQLTPQSNIMKYVALAIVGTIVYELLSKK